MSCQEKASTASHPTLSIVAPAYNEELCLPLFYEKVSAQLDSMGITWEIVFVNDGSRDRTLEVAKALHARDARVKVVHFSRNFGSQVAISAGLDASSGDAVVIMDADLQHPPEVIPEMLRLWRDEGFYIVHAVRESYNKQVGFFKRTASKWYYRFINTISDVQLIQGAAEFRLLDRRVVEEVKNIHERSRFLRALFQWVGFRSTTLPFQEKERPAGTSSFSAVKQMTMALDGIVSFSTKPLRWIMYLGFFAAVACLPYAMWAIIRYLIYGHETPGWASLIVSNIFFGGVQLISIGVIGEYVGRIYTEIKARPLYIVQERYGFGDDDLTGNSAAMRRDSLEPAEEPALLQPEVVLEPAEIPSEELQADSDAPAEGMEPASKNADQPVLDAPTEEAGSAVSTDASSPEVGTSEPASPSVDSTDSSQA